jgi:hypothetical protein
MEQEVPTINNQICHGKQIKQIRKNYQMSTETWDYLREQSEMEERTTIDNLYALKQAELD